MSYMDLSTWRKNFLVERDLEEPTGDNLYSYKMSENEFNRLEASFRNWIRQRGFLNIIDTSLFHQMFVIYAAEWWKRKYNGGHWTWNNILGDLGIDANDWLPNKRSECVIDGLRLWRIRLDNSLGKRFLGGIAIQGGLPINLMADNQGSVLKVLNRIFDLVTGKKIDIDLVKSWIQNISHNLPRTYQRDEIYSLLAQVIYVLASFKNDVNTDNSEVLIREWNNSRKWQNKFPISSNDENTISIIENLIQKVAKTKPNTSSNFIFSKRVIDLNADYENYIQTIITLENFIETNALYDYFQISSDDALSMVLTLEIQAGSMVQEVGLRRLIGSEKYKLNNNIISNFYGKESYCEVFLTLRDNLGNRWSAKSSEIEPMDTELPWVFEKNEQDEFVLVGQGSCKIKSDSFIAIFGDNIEYENVDNLRKIDSSLNTFNVFEFSSNTIFKNEYDEKFKVETKFSGLKESVSIDGDSISAYFLNSSQAYRGHPEIKIIEESGRVRWQTYNLKVGEKIFPSNQTRIYGPVRAFFGRDGQILWKKTIVILPDNSSEEMIHSKSPKHGYWKLYNWKVANMLSLTPNIEIQKRETDTWSISYTGTSSIPHSFQAELFWLDNNKSCKVEFLFPSKGVQANQNQNKVIENGSSISLSKMHGIRLDILPADTEQVKIEIGTTRSMLKNIPFSKGEINKQLRLNDFKKYFEKYLSLSGELDSVVNFNIYFDDRKVFSLFVNRYGFRPLKKDNTWYLPQDILESITKNSLKLLLKAQRIDAPGVDELDIEYVESGLILLPDIITDEEPWLLYTAESSDVIMRPTLLSKIIDRNLQFEIEEDKYTLSKVILEPNKKNRLKAIDRVLADMVQNPQHEDWVTVTRLINEFGHLPLSTLDIWSRAIKNYDFMAMLVCSHINVESDFIDRFSVELPFLFEFIPIYSFEKALRFKMDILNKGLKNSIIFEMLSTNYNVSDWVFEQFKNTFKLALYRIFGDIDRSFVVGNEKMIQGWLFDNPDSDYQKLRQAHELTSNNWLTYNDLFRMIIYYNKQIKNFFKINEEYRSVTVNTPLVLAFLSFNNIYEDLYHNKDYVLMYRKLKDFDEQWFNSAFNNALLILHYKNKML